MARAGYSKKPRLYIPKCRKNEANPPIFQVRRLSPPELIDISERFSDPNESFEFGGIAEPEAPGEKPGEPKKFKIQLKTINNLAKSKYAIVETAVSGWERVEDEDNQPMPFSRENISCLDSDIIEELADVAQGKISGEEVKNSVPPSVSAPGSQTAG